MSANSSSPETHDPYAALRHLNFRAYAAGNALSIIGMQMTSLAIGWQLLERTNSATALGLVGFFQVFPIIALALVAGQVADRFNRKTIVMLDQFALACSASALALASLYHNALPDLSIFSAANRALAALASVFGETHNTILDPHNRHIPILYAILFINGIVRAFNQPTKQSLLPQLVPPSVFPNAVTWNSSFFETCTVIGPMLAGVLIALLRARNPEGSPIPYATVYFVTAGCQLSQLLFFLPIRLIPMPRTREPLTLRSLLAGFGFVWNTRAIFATISLDLFAVLLGGATGLLPMYAKILNVGPLGLGFLRAMPSVGAVTMAMTLAHCPPLKRAGRTLLLAVAAFGIAIIVFGLTAYIPARPPASLDHLLHATWDLRPTLGFAIALIALFFSGVFDNVSVVVRHTLVQTLTPDHMRGRVSAVNSVFISCSNELGTLESGLVAAAFGPAISVISGGLGTIAVVIAIAHLFPQITRITSLKDLKPVGEPRGFEPVLVATTNHDAAPP